MTAKKSCACTERAVSAAGKPRRARGLRPPCGAPETSGSQAGGPAGPPCSRSAPPTEPHARALQIYALPTHEESMEARARRLAAPAPPPKILTNQFFEKHCSCPAKPCSRAAQLAHTSFAKGYYIRSASKVLLVCVEGSNAHVKNSQHLSVCRNGKIA